LYLNFFHKKIAGKGTLFAAHQAAPNLTINIRSRICVFSVCLLYPGIAATIAAHSELT